MPKSLPLQENHQRGTGSPTRKKVRRRIRRACEPCRHRKVKCDGTNPCDICVGYGYSCVYASSETPTPKQISSVGNFSPQTISQSPGQQSIPSDSRTVDNGEPQSQLYILSEEHQSPKTGNTRFTRVDSAIAFPRSLGLSLHADDPPRLQPFAWNTGTRTENPSVNQPNLLKYLTRPAQETFSSVFFSSMNPTFDLINQEELTRRAARCWENQTIDPGFGAVLCGVVALGSLFSPHTSFAHEAEIVEQVRLTLDSTFAHSSVLFLSADFVVGWILRALYLRSTTSPHVSWVASCMAMHIAESIGLHQEMSEIKTKLQTRVMSEAEINTRRKVFWVACSLNRLFAVQYGRSKIWLQNVACRYPTAPISDDRADDFVSLIRLLPDLCGATSIVSLEAVTGLTDSMVRLGKISVYKLPLLLFRADAVFCIYRKLRHVGIALSATQIDVVLSVIRSALVAADSLALQLQQWWTIVSVPFHSICVLITLNTTESLALLYKAMETLQNVARIFDSHVSREAVRTAHYLVKGLEKKKKTESDSLQRCLDLNADMVTSSQVEIPSFEEISEFPLIEWPTDFDLGFVDWLNTGHMNGDTGIVDGMGG